MNYMWQKLHKARKKLFPCTLEWDSAAFEGSLDPKAKAGWILPLSKKTVLTLRVLWFEVPKNEIEIQNGGLGKNFEKK